MYHRLVRGPDRPSRELLERFQGVWTSTLSDTMGRHGGMGPEIRPLWEGAEIIGSAVTVLCFPGDNLTVHKALQTLQEGDVLVIDAGRADNTSIMGHNMSLKARNQGAVGMVTNGTVRDVRLLREDAFPIFCAGICPRSPQKNTFGAVNAPIQVGGVTVKPGDIVCADEDGVAVVPLEIAERVATEGVERMQMEHQQAEDIRSGKEPLEILWGASWVDERLSESELYEEVDATR